MFKLLLSPNEAGRLAPIEEENPQRNEVERGFGTESGELIFKYPKMFRFL